MSLRQWLFSNTAGSTITAAGLRSSDGAQATSVGLGGGTAVYDASGHVGNCALLTNADGANMSVRLPFAGTASNAAAVELRSKAATLPAATFIFGQLRHSGGPLFRFGITPQGALVVQTNTGSAIATSADGRWAINRWNRIAVRFNNSGGTTAGTFTVEIYDDASTTPLETLTTTTGNLGTATAAAFDVGCVLTTNAPWAHRIDSIQMDDGRTTFIPAYAAPTRTAALAGTGTLSTAVSTVHTRTATLSGSGSLSGTVVGQVHSRSVALSGSGSLAGVTTQRPARSVALSGAGTLSVAVEVLPLVVAFSGSGTLGVLNVRGVESPPITFSYWEKRPKEFGPAVDREDHMPFLLQSYPQGTTIVRYADGSIAPVRVVTEELEALDGARIFWGGKDNPVTPEEADQLTAAGYGDYLTFPAGTGV